MKSQVKSCKFRLKKKMLIKVLKQKFKGVTLASKFAPPSAYAVKPSCLPEQSLLKNNCTGHFQECLMMVSALPSLMFPAAICWSMNPAVGLRPVKKNTECTGGKTSDTHVVLGIVKFLQQDYFSKTAEFCGAGSKGGPLFNVA